MGRLLVLDAEALSALAHARTYPKAAGRARAVLRVAYDTHAIVRVPAPVLAEVCRGNARDAAVHRILSDRGIGIVNLDAAIARCAGGLLEARGLGSAHAIDAFVVATTIVLGGGIIATHDVDDLRRLATDHSSVSIWPI